MLDSSILDDNGDLQKDFVARGKYLDEDPDDGGDEYSTKMSIKVALIFVSLPNLKVTWKLIILTKKMS